MRDLYYIVGIGIIVFNFLISKKQEKILGDGFNVINGGFLGIPILIVAGLFIPKVEELVFEITKIILYINGIHLPKGGTIGFWILLVVCGVFILIQVWAVFQETSNIVEFVVKMLLVLLFAIINTIGMLIFAHILVRIFIGAILILIAYIALCSSGGSSSVTVNNVNNSDDKKIEGMYDSEGNYYPCYIYNGAIHIQKGTESVWIKENGNGYYVDEKGNLYHEPY